mmetsp:Transcript_24985/g.83387  ORF Transcript_24985/g.83387 Transcript_24985/m.83387 type:complete len:205 (+) Transcript_24985:339-953(+)
MHTQTVSNISDIGRQRHSTSTKAEEMHRHVNNIDVAENSINADNIGRSSKHDMLLLPELARKARPAARKHPSFLLLIRSPREMPGRCQCVHDPDVYATNIGGNECAAPLPQCRTRDQRHVDAEALGKDHGRRAESRQVVLNLHPMLPKLEVTFTLLDRAVMRFRKQQVDAFWSRPPRLWLEFDTNNFWTPGAQDIHLLPAKLPS